MLMSLAHWGGGGWYVRLIGLSSGTHSIFFAALQEIETCYLRCQAQCTRPTQAALVASMHSQCRVGLPSVWGHPHPSALLAYFTVKLVVA